MTRIPVEERNLIEKAIYLPMVMTVLNRDLMVIDQSPFKLKKPYLQLVEETLKVIQKEMAEVKWLMREKQLKVEEIRRDEAFTTFMFLYKGYEEHHNYFNPRIRNKVQELLEYYLFRRHMDNK
jgi:hypothetical protein